MAYFLLSFVLTKLWQGGAACFSLIEEREKTGAQVDLIAEVAGTGGAERNAEVHLIGAAAKTAGKVRTGEPILGTER